MVSAENFARAFVRGAHRDQDRVLERREIATLTEFQFLLEIAGEIVVPRELNRGTERRVGLHEHFARRFAAAGAPGDLREQLKRPFARAEIRHMQRQIGVDDSDERDVRKMQAFRDHLRADEDVDLAGAKICAGFAIRFLSRHRVRVHPAHDRLRENLRDGRLHFLRSEAGINQRVLAAGRTFLWHGRGVPAQDGSSTAPTLSMKCERDAAIRAVPRFAAIAAKERRRKPAAIEKQNCLLVFLEPIWRSRCAIFRTRWRRPFLSGVPAADRRSASAASACRPRAGSDSAGDICR